MGNFEIAFNVTAWFETGGDIWGNVSGNFDGQGLSYGPRQNCIGQGSLQPLLRRALQASPNAMENAFGPRFSDLKTVLSSFSTKDQLDFVIKNWNGPNNRLVPTVEAAFKAMGQIPEVQQVFMDDAKGSLPAVEELSEWLAQGGPRTLRMYCLAYDIVTQNGGIATDLRDAIMAALPHVAQRKKDERDFLRVMAWERSTWVYVLGNRAFARDVLGRKLLIIEGQGHFRGEDVDLDAKFGVSDEEV